MTRCIAAFVAVDARDRFECPRPDPSASAGSSDPARQAQPAPLPTPPTPPTLPTPARPAQTAPAPPPAPPAPPRAPPVRRLGQAVNVKVDVTITDQSGKASPLRKTLTVVTADGLNGRVQVAGELRECRRSAAAR